MKVLWILLAVAGAAAAQDINANVLSQASDPYARANWPFNFQLPSFHVPNVLQPLTTLPIFNSNFWQPWFGGNSPKPAAAPSPAPAPPQLAPPVRDDGSTIAALVNAINGLQEVVARLQSRQQILLSMLRCSNANINNCSRDFVSSQQIKLPLEPALGSDLSWLLDGLPAAHETSAQDTANLAQNAQSFVPASLGSVPNYLNQGLQNLGSYFGNAQPRPQQPSFLPNVLNNGFQNVPNFLNNGYQTQQGFPVRYPTNNFINYPNFAAGINTNKFPDNPNVLGFQGNLFPGNGIPGTSNLLQGGGSLFAGGLPNSAGSALAGGTNFLQGAGSLFPNGLANSVSTSSSSTSSGDGTSYYTAEVSDNGSGKPTFTSISSTSDGTGTVIVSSNSEDGGKPHVTKLERDAKAKST